MPFAYYVARMHPELIGTAMGRPGVPEEIPSALETFRGMKFGQHAGLFDYANFAEVYIYLRGGRGLEIPNQEWRDQLPKEMTAARPWILEMNL